MPDVSPSLSPTLSPSVWPRDPGLLSDEEWQALLWPAEGLPPLAEASLASSDAACFASTDVEQQGELS
jgi:hypothetical protein